jgi:tRNA-dihydrouridine synthase B
MIPRGFWQDLERPIVGLAPMDGVTNAPFRLVTARYGRPDVIFTEFVPIDGLMHRATRLLRDFRYSPEERPIVAQIYGTDPQGCYAVSHLLCAMGFDGIDINMGCPAKNVAARGAGAGLIRTPRVAQALIRAAQRGVRDWCDGQSPEDAGVPDVIVEAARAMQLDGTWHATQTRQPIPVTVKTRIGFDEVRVDDWIYTLLEAEPVVISIHGRTLKQMYRGMADWEAIGRAVELAKDSPTSILGNGDITTPQAMRIAVEQTHVDGLLVGRGAMGNPMLFRWAPWLRAVVAGEAVAQPITQPDERLKALIDHAYLTESLVEPKGFQQLYRFIKPYTVGLQGGAQLRKELYAARSANVIKGLLQPVLAHCDATGAA